MSEYPSFEALIDNDNGTFTPLALATVHVYDVSADEALDNTASDSQGTVPGASVDVPAGTLLRFSVRLANGLAGYAEAVTV